MKKYLMTGIAAVAMCAAFTSCSTNEVETLTPGEIQAMKYAESFAKTFGAEIDPQNDWGFGKNESQVRTRVSSPNDADGNGEWMSPAPIGQDEINKVKAHFSNPANYRNCTNPNPKYYWVQQVWKGDSIYYEKVESGALQSFTGSDHMDYLQTLEADGWKEIQRFNNANGGGTNKMMMVNSSTLQFRYYNSLGSEWKEQHFLMQEIDGQYYVGFDFDSDNPVHYYEGNGIYDDWIVKIVPGKMRHDKWTGRIYCEDLGAIDDFDFNDVVFDYDFDNGKTYIKLLAAGGTIPLYIGDTAAEHEVHKLFGVATNVMVNTGRATRDEVIFVLNSTYNYSAADIPVIVDLSSYAENNDENTSENLKVLVANKGEAPQKVCVKNVSPLPNWPSERERITTPYPKFDNYIKDHTVEWWKK